MIYYTVLNHKILTMIAGSEQQEEIEATDTTNKTSAESLN